METPGPQGKTRNCPSGTEDLVGVGKCPSLLWASTLSFDNLTCGICPGEVRLAETEVRSCPDHPEGSGQLSL